MTTVFISYRQSDTLATAIRLYNKLQSLFPADVVSIFFDQSPKALPLGEPFPLKIDSAIQRGGICLLLIGPNWLRPEMDGSRRLFDPRDHHRQEIVKSLERGLLLIPIYVDLTVPLHSEQLPEDIRELLLLQSVFVKNEVRGLRGVNKLVQRIISHVQDRPPSAGSSRSRSHEAGEAAIAPDDLETAVPEGQLDVARVLSDLSEAGAALTVDDISLVVSTAISHGAGIYNHRSRDAGHMGCARIYHQAASGVVELIPLDSTDRWQGLGLAAQWLRRILTAEPTVSDDPEVADALAWELRFCFDSMSIVQVCSSVSEIFRDSTSWNWDRDLCQTLVRIVEFSQTVGPLHVADYFLRHALEVVQDRVPVPQTANVGLRTAHQKLFEMLRDHPRITKYNVELLNQALLRGLATVVQAILGPGSG